MSCHRKPSCRQRTILTATKARIRIPLRLLVRPDKALRLRSSRIRKRSVATPSRISCARSVLQPVQHVRQRPVMYDREPCGGTGDCDVEVACAPAGIFENGLRIDDDYSVKFQAFDFPD